MKHLLKHYERTLKLISEELTAAINEATDINKIICLTIKRDCYKTFIKELKPLVPADKPIDPKIFEAERKEQEQRDKEREDKDAAFIARLMADEEPIKMPKGFEDFESCGGK